MRVLSIIVTIVMTALQTAWAQNNSGLFSEWTETDYSEYEITHEFFTPGGVSPSASGKYDMTGYIPVKEGDVIVFSGDRSPGIPFIMGYADNQGSGATVLLGNFDATDYSNLSVTEEEVTIPAGTSYVRCSARNTSVPNWASQGMSVIKRSPTTKEPIVRILAIGNSFAIDAMESDLYNIAKASGIRLVLGNACQAGYSLQNHLEALTTNLADLEYRKCVDRHYSVNKGYTLRDILFDEPWDFITFQQTSYYAGLYETYEPYLTDLINNVKSIVPNPEAKYGFYMVWAYAQNSTHSMYGNYNHDQMTMFNGIVDATSKAMETHPELDFLIPTGTAVQNIRTSFVGDNLTRDGAHLTEDLGRSIAAYSWFATLFGTDEMMRNTFVPYRLNEYTTMMAKNCVASAIEAPYTITPQIYPDYATDNTTIPDDIYLNFSHEGTHTDGWNDVTLHHVLTAGFKDRKGEDSKIIIQCNKRFGSANVAGHEETCTSFDMPSEVSQSALWGYTEGTFHEDPLTPAATLHFKHLNKALTYDFTFFSSRAYSTDNRETQFTLAGTDTLSTTLDASDNKTNTVTIPEMRPDKDGTITLTVTAGPNNDNPYHFYYLNAMCISAHKPTIPSETAPEVLAKYSGLGLPLVCITTTDGMDPTSEGIMHPEGMNGASITNVVPKEARMQIFRADTLWYDSGEYQEDESGIKIKHRGNTSAYYFNNKPFKLKLQKKADLVDFHEAEDTVNRKSKDWVLLNDAERLHVYIANQMARLIGMEYTPRMEFANVIINNDYRGIYMLSENVKRDKDCRINVDKDSGYIIELDAYFWNETFSIPSKLTRFLQWTMKYPEPEDMTEEMEVNIRSDISRLEKAVSSDNYPEVIDVHSIARWILLHDIMGTHDPAGSNVYVARQNTEPTSLMRMPVAWDLGSSMDYLDEWSKTHAERGLFFSRLFANDLCLDFDLTYLDEWKRVLQAGMMEQMAQKCLEIPSTAQGQGLKLSYPLHTKRWGFGTADVEKMASEASQWFIDRRQSLEILIKGLEDYVTAVGSPSEESREGNFIRKQICNGRIIIVTPEGKYTLTGQKL